MHGHLPGSHWIIGSFLIQFCSRVFQMPFCKTAILKKFQLWPFLAILPTITFEVKHILGKVL